MDYYYELGAEFGKALIFVLGIYFGYRLVDKKIKEKRDEEK